MSAPTSPAPRAPALAEVAAIVQVVAHELKTPITSLKASLQLLAKDAPGWAADRQELLAVAQRGVERLAGLTQEFLDMVALQQDALEVNLRPILLEPFLESLLASSRARLKRQDLRLVAPEPGLAVQADEARLLQVFGELLENAAKCSREGSGIEIAARPGGLGVVLSVADRGKGVPIEHREEVFGPFFQIDASTTRDVPGLGLGLAICRGLIGKQGGRIWIEGRPAGASASGEAAVSSVGSGAPAGLGTIVLFTLPAARAAGPVPEEPAHVQEDHSLRR